MRVLVLGSPGPIGKASVSALVRAGHYVVASRTTRVDTGRETMHLLVDRAHTGAVLGVIRELRIDIVVDFLAFTEAGTLPLLRTLDGSVARYVLISSGDVYRNYGLLQRLETGQAQLDALDETAPLRTSRYPYRGTTPRQESEPRRWMDDYDKIPIEQATEAMKSDWTVLRLPMVFGPGDRQRRFL